jgi:hypothetical protein
MSKERARRPGPLAGETQVCSGSRLLRGEDLAILSRELDVAAATLSSRRDQFLKGSQRT